jgi:hypothetical protein
LEEPPASQTWDSERWRLYVVWVIPAQEVTIEYRGVHWGEDLAAYGGILYLNRGRFAEIAWRRAFSVREAVDLFVREAAWHDVPSEPIFYYRWQRN